MDLENNHFQMEINTKDPMFKACQMGFLHTLGQTGQFMKVILLTVIVQEKELWQTTKDFY